MIGQSRRRSSQSTLGSSERHSHYNSDEKATTRTFTDRTDDENRVTNPWMLPDLLGEVCATARAGHRVPDPSSVVPSAPTAAYDHLGVTENDLNGYSGRPPGYSR